MVMIRSRRGYLDLFMTLEKQDRIVNKSLKQKFYMRKSVHIVVIKHSCHTIGLKYTKTVMNIKKLYIGIATKSKMFRWLTSTVSGNSDVLIFNLQFLDTVGFDKKINKTSIRKLKHPVFA